MAGQSGQSKRIPGFIGYGTILMPHMRAIDITMWMAIPLKLRIWMNMLPLCVQRIVVKGKQEHLHPLGFLVDIPLKCPEKTDVKYPVGLFGLPFSSLKNSSHFVDHQVLNQSRLPKGRLQPKKKGVFPNQKTCDVES